MFPGIKASEGLGPVMLGDKGGEVVPVGIFFLYKPDFTVLVFKSFPIKI
jgi:hypothetical protein